MNRTSGHLARTLPRRAELAWKLRRLVRFTQFVALHVLTVFGTCPEAIKLAPVMRELRRHPDRVVRKGAEEQ